MNEKKMKRRTTIFRILILIATYVGISAVRGFFDVRLAAGTQDDYTVLAMVAGLSMDYLTFLLLAVVVFVMNFFTKAAIRKKYFIIRSIALGLAIILIWYSAPSISYIAYVGASRYTDMTQLYPVDLDFIRSYISGNLWTVFSYMVSAGIYVVMTIISIYTMFHQRKSKQERDVY